MKNLILGLLMLGAFQLMAQRPYYSQFQQEYFFGNLPSQKTAAMGGADVAVGGAVNSIFLNPAGLGLIGDQEITFSTSAPFYALTRSDYYFLGYGRRINDKLTVGLTVNQISVGPTTFSTEINGTRYDVQTPGSTNIAATGVYSPIKGLQLGANVNVLILKYFEGVKKSPAIHVDLGALYKYKLGDNQALQVGFSMANVYGANVTITSPMGDAADNNLPVVMRGAIAYVLHSQICQSGDSKGDFDFTATLGYQNVLNSDYRTTVRIGTEAIFWKALAVRLGYFTQSLDNLNNPDHNRSRINDFTYGFGIILPFDEFTKGALPFQAHIDYVSQKQPSVVWSGRRLPNMRGFGLRLVWPLRDGS